MDLKISFLCKCVGDQSQENLFSVIIETLSTENCGKSLREHLDLLAIFSYKKEFNRVIVLVVQQSKPPCSS